jgi:hypothetical protein
MSTLLRGCGCLLLLIILAIGGGAYSLWKVKQEMPADAQRDTLFTTHRALINRLDAAIRAADGFTNAAERLKAIATDTDLLYLQLEEAGGTQRIDVLKRLSWEGNSTRLWNGAGAGSLRTTFGTQDIRIISSSERTATGMLLTYTFYLAHGQATPLNGPDQPLERVP